jgi:hypothetical protein
VRLEVLGQEPDEIAAALGMTKGSVTELTKHPEYEKVRDEYLTKMYQRTDEMIAERKAGPILDEAAPDAAERLADLVFSQDEVTARIAATAVLDRTGHGPIQRKATKVRHELDPIAVELLRKGLEAAGKAKQLKGEVIDVEPS